MINANVVINPDAKIIPKLISSPFLLYLVKLYKKGLKCQNI